MAKTKPDIRTKAQKSSSPTPSPIMKYLPYAIAFLTFIVITLVFFGPMLLDDKSLSQGDINQFDGMSKEIVDFRANNHTEPLWTNSMFGGMPAFQISTVYNGNLIQYVEKALGLGLPEFTGYLFIACLGFYLLLVVMAVNPWLAIAGAIAYGLASYNLIILEAGHNTKMHAIALLPYVVTGFMLLWQRKYMIGAAVSALSFSMLINANHVQIAYYLFITLLIAGVVFLIFSVLQKDIKHYVLAFGIFAGCGAIGVASNLSLLWTTYEYGNSTIRGKSDLTSNTESKGGLDRSYAFSYSYTLSEAFNLLIPNFMGGSSSQDMAEGAATTQALRARGVQQEVKMPTYWGDQPFTSGPSYMGAFFIFLFVLGLFIVDGPFKWWLGIATLLAIVLSFGYHLAWFNNAFFDYFPGYNKFRTVTMSLIICQLTIPLLAVLTIQKLINGEVSKEKAITGLYISAGITAGISLIFALFGGSLLNFSSMADMDHMKEYAQAFRSTPEEMASWLLPAIKADRLSIMRSDALRALMLILLGAGLIWLVIQDKISKTIAIAGVIIICLFDYISVGTRFINGNSFIAKSDKENRFTESSADQTILQDKSLDYRVFNTTVNPFADASTSYHHKSVGGYHAAKLRRYQELYDNQIAKGNIQVLNMLNTKYVIQGGPNGRVAVQNPTALGNAWFVEKAEIVPNADAEIKALDNFDPKVTAFVDKQFTDGLKGFAGGKDPASKIELTSYAPNHLVYEYSAPQTQLAVFSEIYYQPGWKATVDGKEVPLIRANYVLRAAVLPAGSHKVEMVFEPASYFTGEKIAYASSTLILLLLAVAIYMEVKRRKQQPSVAA